MSRHLGCDWQGAPLVARTARPFRIPQMVCPTVTLRSLAVISFGMVLPGVTVYLIAWARVHSWACSLGSAGLEWISVGLDVSA